MNSETLKLADPELVKAVKVLRDESVPTGEVAVLTKEGYMTRMPLKDWEAQVRAEIAERDRQEKEAAGKARLRHARNRRERRAKAAGRQRNRAHP